MVIHFYIKYKTNFGQSLIIRLTDPVLSTGADHDIKLNYLNDEYWYGNFDTDEQGIKDSLKYYYILREYGKPDRNDLCKNRSLSIKKIEADEINVFDDWQEYALEETVFNSKPFTQVFGQAKVKEPTCKKPTHLFEVHANHLPDDKLLCICGAGKKMNDWDLSDPVIMKRKKNSWTVKLNLAKENFPLEYKFGVYDIKQKKAIFLEDGSNRVIYHQGDKDKLNVFRQFTVFHQHTWKGAGVNIQLSALKSENSWGIGDFTDLNLLTDWSVQTGIKLVQLLPINDTTATHDRKDSYPYSAISAFALHPVFLNIQKLAIAASLEFSDSLLQEVKDLNELPQLDYDSVISIKEKAIRLLYEKDKHSFKDDFAYFDFFDLNRHWLVPYAAFCFLRDKYNTADFTQWKEHQQFDEDAIQEFVSPDKPHYDDIAIHYFTQYHLHLQLIDAVEYAHKNGVIIKGDLPIGVGRFSVDTWMHPHLFHMDMQAGAPPDAFTVKGQNWSFPTYNWELMQHDDYAWWRQRMEHMTNYFDAIRIDHVLGFFRIWSIPMYAIDGIFGRFMPAYPLSINDFERAGISFNEDRLCNPYFTDDIINSTFGEHATWVKENVLEGGRIRDTFNTQQKVAAYFVKHPEKSNVQQGLFDLLCNVVLLKDENKAHAYHFRISMQSTSSYQHMATHDQHLLNELYRQYFFENQNDLWYHEAQGKLDAIQKGTNMLICAEDLGMVPEMVEDVLKNREILSLQVQRMPKTSEDQYTHPKNASYLTVVTPSTHDMSTLREWWEEDKNGIQSFYNHFLGQQGTAPYYCEPWISREIIAQHMHSPAMWAVFLLQDLMAMDDHIRRENPADERINIPANPNHYWNYRMHITLEHLLEQETFSESLMKMVKDTGR